MGIYRLILHHFFPIREIFNYINQLNNSRKGTYFLIWYTYFLRFDTDNAAYQKSLLEHFMSPLEYLVNNTLKNNLHTRDKYLRWDNYICIICILIFTHIGAKEYLFKLIIFLRYWTNVKNPKCLQCKQKRKIMHQA